VAKNWRKAREGEHLTTLKMQMVERGMSADEIERVLSAGVPSKPKKEDE
jgi:hypothetical protein